MRISARPALAALLLLAACGESAEQPAAEETAAPQEVEFTPDFAAATQEAVADTEAAVREAGASIDAPVAPKVEAPVVEPAAPAEAADEEVEQ